MTFKLCEDRVAVLADEVSDTTESGIVLVPDSSAAEQMQYGTVVVVGRGRLSEYTHEYLDPGFVEGDRVFFNRHSGSTISVEGTEYKFLNKTEIVGVLETDLSIAK